MNKKYLSALLFGAVMIASTGTFTSCKDYDDDIQNLQEQINAQKSTLEDKVAAVETTIKTLQDAQASLEQAIADAESAALKAAREAQAAAIEQAKADLEDAKSELMALIEANSEETEAVQNQLAEIAGKIQTLQQFKSNTEETLADLAAADVAINNTITDLAVDVAENAKKIGANEAAIEAQKTALEKYKESNDAAVQENADAIDQLIEDLKALEAGQLTEAKVQEIAEQVTKAVSADLDMISAAIAKMVTHVELVEYNEGNPSAPVVDGSFYTMDLRTAKALQTYTFGKDEIEAGKYEIQNQVTFTEGQRTFLTDSVLIRVSPTNATLTSGQVSFVNSELGTLDDLIEVTEVKPYEGMITRGISSNGLWKVIFKLKDLGSEEANDEAYMKAAKYEYDQSLSETVINKLPSIKYAVAVKDQPTKELERYVTSGYDLTLGADYTPIYYLDYKVNDTNVNYIYNRFHHAEEQNPSVGPSWVLDENKDLLYDYKWNTNNAGDEIIAIRGEYTSIDATGFTSKQTIAGKQQDVYPAGPDNREDQPFFTAQVGEPFTVELDYSNVKMSGVYGFYVVYDERRAVESAPSEINAWNSYVENIDGLNTITTSKSLTLKINDAKAEGDILGFRVYAINQNGVLVDPDGKAFYVAVGDFEMIETATTYVPTYDATTQRTNEYAVVEIPAEIQALLSAQEDCEIANWRMDEVNNPIVDNVQAVFSPNAFLDANGDVTTDKTKAVSIRLRASQSAYYYKDYGKYTIFYDVKNPKGMIVKTCAIVVTKEMPGFPEAFSAKDKQVINGVHKTVGMYDWSNYRQNYDFTEAFNGLVDIDGTNAHDIHYIFETVGENSEYLEAVGTGWGHYVLKWKNGVTNDQMWETIGEQVAIEVAYKYSLISSETDDRSWVVEAPAEKNFKIELVCMEDLTAVWNKWNQSTATKQTIKYGQHNSVRLGDHFDIKKNGSNYNSFRNAIGAEEIKDVRLVSSTPDGTEYFTVTFSGNETLNFEPVVDAIRPAEAVPSTLIFTYIDAFGHEKEASFPYYLVQ